MSKDLRKTVELATKPKRAAPKAKYIDPIVQSTFSQDGQLQEIVRTLSLRIRDPNTTVAFKSLITLHTIMRSGSLEPVYSYLANSSLASTLASHEAPNIQAYGKYLAARIRSYQNLNRDVIRDKTDRRTTKDRLRKLHVEQGLLRETREIQRMIAACVESKFFTDDVDDDVSMTALRLLTKDLLVLFTCVNEGMINILEHYFEMSHTDATTALKIYKTFCRDTERVVSYLSIAKKLYNVLNVPIPNLKHAPVSLAGSLEEYLNDPNFEKNREEYKENKRVADGGQPGTASPAAAAPSKAPAPSTSTSTAPTPSTAAGAPSAPAPQAKSFTDFFESIEQSQTSMFPGSPSMNGTLSSQMTGFGAPNPFGSFAGGGFGQFPMVQPQMTGYGNPFLQQPQPTGFAAGPFQPPQMTGPFGQFQQPQMTGVSNPFRQSMMMTGAPGGGQMMMMPPVQPQMTGGNPFQQQLQPQTTGFNQRPMSMMMTGAPNPFAPTSAQSPPQHPFGPSRTNTFSPSPSMPTIPQQSSSTSSSAPPSNTQPYAQQPPAPLTAQKTGARNPFAPAGTLIPQTQQPEPPKGPSMNQLAAFSQQQPQQQQSQTTTEGGGGQGAAPQDAFSKFLQAQKTGQLPPQPLTASKTGGLFASIASDFTFDRSSASGGPSNDPTPSFSSTTTNPFPGSASNNSTFSATSQPPLSTSTSFLSPQLTGFGGNSTRKPFQPSSSFGSNLMSEFSNPATASAPPSSSSTLSPTSFASTSATTTTTNGLVPQSTGYNPFAGSKLPPLNSSLSNGTAATTFNGQFGTGSHGNAGSQPLGGVQVGSLI
ncbi:uncharacterized protein JCM15063_003143 [Sporobolomyces koalae]|uniref:uncharacterized protein n=1 Tax=Sporobolomyces koalae TaxID=500713 RepID=UPI003178090A